MQGYTLRGIVLFLAQEKNEKNIHPLQGLPRMWGGCNRSSCRSYTKVSSDHQRSGLIFYYNNLCHA